ncbi:sodium- and chloride-dependent neutral and basic amino acid transporter B(0+)-like [Parambassis ranga]|uniref:Transporter n=1 Tax=Parambassis ranga TaxID=210632 RepID=A0A6P7I505_9TELE|nr:sodium- and chloride-dependent neutral and basic amino acid transporter B(0+)-like [Parambassis ranga]
MGTLCSKSLKDPPDTAEDAPENGDRKPERDNWASWTEYMVSQISSTVGLGTIWRFPYLTFRNGGGAFLIPCFISMFLCGIPMLALESAIGQFCSQGPIHVWRATPIMQGVGWAMITTNIFMTVYYSVIIAYGLYYLFASMQSPLPWSSCFSWADTYCSNTPIEYCNVSGILMNMVNWTQENHTCPSSKIISVPVQSSSEQYWDRVVLQRSSGLDETGSIFWPLALCLLLSWIIIAAVVSKGIKSSSKVLYFTTTFPYLVILILLIRGMTLEGAQVGIDYYIGFQSNLTKLTESQAWRDAVTQTFFSLTLGWGGIINYASYSNFHSNMFLNAVIVGIVNQGTSVFAGFAIFSILGHMASVYGVPIENVVIEGFGLTFIVYPAALAQLPVAPLWSVLFFLMICSIGVGTVFSSTEVINTCLVDLFPQIRSKRVFLTVGVSALLFLLGLPCVTKAGIYWVTLMDYSVSVWMVLILACTEIIGFCYIYGVNRLIKDIEMMIGKRNFWYWLWWKTCWLVICPCILVFILIWSLIPYTPPTYGGVHYPDWGLALGWCMVGFVLIWIPCVMVFKIATAKGTIWERLKFLCSPSEEWHPYLEINRGDRYAKKEALSTKDKKM